MNNGKYFNLPLAIAALAAAALTVVTWPYVEDDAYIHCQFARNLLERGEFSFNPGERVPGDTAPLWVAMTCAVRLLGVDYPDAVKILSAFFGFLAAVIFLLLCQSLWGTDKNLDWLVLILFALHPVFITLVPSGMETTFALSCLMAFCILAERTFAAGACDEIAAPLGLGIMGGIASLVRPEFILLVPCALLPLLVAWKQHPERRRDIARSIAWCAAGWIASTGVLLMIHYGYFGRFTPTTMRGKSYGPTLFAPAAIIRMIKVLAFCYGPLALAAVAALLFPRGRSRIALPNIPRRLATWSIMLVAGYIAISAAVQTRYAILLWPIAACLYVGIAKSCARRRQTAAVLAAGIAVLCLQSAVTAWPALANRVRNARAATEFAICARAATPSDAAIGTYAIGEMGYRAQRRIIDFGCLATPAMIDLDQAGRMRLATELGVTHLVLQAAALEQFKIPPDAVLCRADYRNATWQFPPTGYRRTYSEVLVPAAPVIEAGRRGRIP